MSHLESPESFAERLLDECTDAEGSIDGSFRVVCDYAGAADMVQSRDAAIRAAEAARWERRLEALARELDDVGYIDPAGELRAAIAEVKNGG